MKKIFILLFVCLFTISSINAQKTDLIFSEKVLVKSGLSKLKILKNGKTANIVISKEDGLVCTLYNANQQKENETKAPLVESNIDYQALKFVMQIDNDIVVMLASYSERIPKLYRFLFDSSTGAFKGSEKIAEMSVMTSTVAVSVVTVQAPDRFIEKAPDFFIEKDPLSDYYAVVKLNSYASETNKMIEVFHYSPQHEKINSAYFVSPENKFKNLWMSDIYVNGSKSVILASYVYNDKADGGGNDAFFYLSQLNADATTFRNVVLTQTLRYTNYDCNFVSDTIAKNVKVIAKIYKNEKEHSFICQIINLQTIEFGEQFQITTEMAKQYFAKNIHIVKEYDSQLQQYVIAKNGNGLILSERVQSAVSGYYHQDVGITGITPNGTELFGVVIRYFHYNMGKSTTYMDASKGSFKFASTDEFNATYLDLITGKNANYLLLNSTSEDIEQPENSKNAYKKILLANSAGLTTFIYTIGKNGELTKTYLFGKPGTDAEAKYCLLHTADYDPQTGLYIVSIVEKVNGKKMTSVVWMHLF